MGKLDINCMRHMGRDEFRTLTAVEMGMKNHEAVPVSLIVTIAGLRHGGAAKCLKTLLRFKLVYHDHSRYDGYRLTWSGYDVLALRALCQRKVIESLGSKIGEGKESDVYEAMSTDGRALAVKFHRLGKTSFKAVKDKRDYLQGRTSAGNWFNMSRLAAQREWTFLSAIHTHTDLRVPIPVDQNRHAVVMTRLEGMTMYQLSGFDAPERVYKECIHAARTLAQRGLVHCDLNEFNIIIDPNELVTIIDFPQMVSTHHENAATYFQRDLNGIRKFFRTKIFRHTPLPDDSDSDLDPEEELSRYAPSTPDDPSRLDISLQASGFPHHGKHKKHGTYTPDDDAILRAYFQRSLHDDELSQTDSGFASDDERDHDFFENQPSLLYTQQSSQQPKEEDPSTANDLPPPQMLPSELAALSDGRKKTASFAPTLVVTSADTEIDEKGR